LTLATLITAASTQTIAAAFRAPPRGVLVSAISATAYFLNEPSSELVPTPLPIDELAASDAVVEVLGCGVCHTDLGFFDGSVRPNLGLPLVLGHEVVGVVTRAGSDAKHLVGQPVLVPAVIPCGACVVCKAGRSNACPNQKMPGNDIHGGFASHMVVPAHGLVSVADAPDGTDLRLLSVVADAVSTAWQACVRADVQEGDVVFVVGAAGGVGGFSVQIAAALGARVVAMDVRAPELMCVAEFGATEAIVIRDLSPRDVRKKAHGLARSWQVPSLNWKVLECSGHPAGQQTAFTLISRCSTYVQVGFTPRKVEVRLSNLMAFDATVHGSWGCPVEAYPDVLKLIYDGRVQLAPFCDFAPLSDVNTVLADMAGHNLTRRIILTP